MLRLLRLRPTVLFLRVFASVLVLACEGGGTEPMLQRLSGPTVATTVTTTLDASTLTVGQTSRATAVAKDVNGFALTSKAVSWSSLNPSVATVSSSGMVTAVTAGTATIRATVDARNGDAGVIVTFPPVASVSVSLASSSVPAGQTTQATAVLKDASGNTLTGPTVTWSSTDSTVATVSSSGLVTAVTAGTATIRASIDARTGDAGLTVTPPLVASVSVSLASSNVPAGQTTQATAVLKDANGNTLTGRTVAWSSTDSTVATVSSSGQVVAVAVGSVTIRAVAEGVTGGAALSVASAGVPVATVSVVAGPRLIVGQTTQATAVAKDMNGNVLTGRVVTWSSLNTNVATVSNTGVVTPAKAGQAVIQATVEKEFGSALLNVSAPNVSMVSVTLAAPGLTVGQTTQATAVAWDSSGSVLTGQAVAWSSLNPAVATVSSLGVVTAVAAGQTTIQATVGNVVGSAGVTVTVTVTAPVAKVATVTATLNAPSLSPGQSTQAIAVAKDSSGNVLTGRVVAWSSLNPAVATVSNVGLVTAVTAGQATIQATVDNIVGSSAVTVTVTAPVAKVAAVTATLNAPNLSPGQSTQATAVARDSSGSVLTGQVVAWSSLNPAVATVSSLGVVTAVAAGQTTIQATVGNVVGSAGVTVTVTVTAPVAKVATVTATLNAASLSPGQSTQATAVAKDSTGNALTGRVVAWSSVNTGVATVSNTGLVTAVTAGQATIRATVETIVGDAALSVTAPVATVAAVTVTLNSPSLTTGQLTQATAVARDASGSVLTGKTVTWTSMSPSIASISAAGLITALSAGSAVISATVSGVVGSATLLVSSSPPFVPSTGPQPALPLSTPSYNIPAPSRVITVPAGADFQAALNAAQPGDELRLASGATYTGSFLLPSQPCSAVSQWVTVRTDIDDSQLPAPGTRMTPSYAPRLAKIASNDYQPTIITTGPICGWRFLALDISETNPPPSLGYGIMRLGDDGWVGDGGKQTTLDRVPQDIVIDRVYLHGGANSENARCLALNTGRATVINSWISDCHASGFDAQAIEGWNGPGPYLIENNFLAGSGENIMFGGADPGIPGLIPSDITIRRNHFWKDPAWKGVWAVKNLLEMKNVQRLLVEANVFENNWIAGQVGMAIVIKSANGNGDGNAPWSGSTDVTIRYNLIRNSPRGFNIQGNELPWDVTRPRPVSRVRFEQNLLYNIGSYNGTGADGWQILLTHNLHDAYIEHNTFINNAPFGFMVVMAYGAPGYIPSNVNVNNNVTNNPNYYAVNTDGGGIGTAAFNTFTGNGQWSFAGNVVPNVDPQFVAAHPQTSFYPSNNAAVGFANYSGGDYRLAPGSTYAGRATDHTNPGADIDEINRRTSGVVITP